MATLPVGNRDLQCNRLAQGLQTQARIFILKLVVVLNDTRKPPNGTTWRSLV